MFNETHRAADRKDKGYMKKKNRREELIDRIKKRLSELDELILMLPPSVLHDTEFEELKNEAIKLREELKNLS